MILLSALFLTGCVKYGTGNSFGYITTQERGLCSNQLWFRAELESSNTDCYVVDDSLAETARIFAKEKYRAEIVYERHLLLICGCSSEKIVQIKKIEG